MDRLFWTTIIPDVFQGMGDDFSTQMSLIWGQIKVTLIVPLLKLAVVICLTMSLMLFIERVYMGIVIMLVKLFGKTPEKRFKWEPLKDDVELGNTVYPIVLIQIPMYNEREVYQLSIGAACDLAWPSVRIIIQVLDDSTDPAIKDLVELECRKWANKGIDIKYEIRDNRDGYKSGALKQGMERDYVAILDADFQPEPDFLARTIPFLVHNSELALVQARWQFAFTPGAGLKCFTASRPFFGPRRRIILCPRGARRASRSNVKHSPLAFSILAVSVNLSAVTLIGGTSYTLMSSVMAPTTTEISPYSLAFMN